MSSKQATISLIIVSLIAAAAIVIASNLWPGPDQTTTYWIIAIWFVPFSWLTARIANNAAKDKGPELEHE